MSQSAKNVIINRFVQGSLTVDTPKHRLTKVVEANIDKRVGNHGGKEGYGVKTKTDAIKD